MRLISTSASLLKSFRTSSTLAGPSARKPFEPQNQNPPLRTQRIILTDGSSFTVLSSSPKPFVVQTKDVKTSPLWNPNVVVLDDESGKMAQFASRFSMDSSTPDVDVAQDSFFKPKPAAKPPAKGKKGR